jgi:hypothetical protein
MKMKYLKWNEAEDFKYDEFQAYWDFEHNFKLTNSKNACEMSFKTAWNFQEAKVIDLEAKNEQLEQQLKEANEVINKGLNSVRFELGEIRENEHTAYDWVIKCVVPYNDKYKVKE